MKNYVLGVLGIIALFMAVWGAGIVMTRYPLQSIISVVVVAIAVNVLRKKFFSGGSAFMQLKERIKKYKTYNQQEEKDKNRMLKLMNTNKDVLTRKNTNHHFTASAWIINEKKDKVLMIHHNIYDTWSWVGGHADGSTELLTVALKETAEETGLTNVEILDENIFSLEILGVQGHMKNREYVPAHLHLNLTYIFQAEETDQLKVNEDETGGVQWIEVNNLAEMCKEPMMMPIYNKLVVKSQSFNTIDILKKRAMGSDYSNEAAQEKPKHDPETTAKIQAIEGIAAREMNARRAEVMENIIKRSR